MTTYYKQVNEYGEPVLLLTYGFTPNITNSRIVEITPEEYATLSAELQAKVEAEEERAEVETMTEQEQKAAAYDILMGTEE